MRFKRNVVALAAIVVLALAGLSTTAAAAPPTTQNGLVNIYIDNTTVQVPIGLAANVCDVNVAAILAVVADAGSTTCTAVANSTAENVMVGTAPDGAVTQNGLVNVVLTNTTIQVPIAAALNICDVNVALLAVLVDAGPATCTATANSKAKNK